MRRRRGIMGLNGGAGIPVITATATGNPLSFVTDMVKPLKSLVIPFTPIQEGSGDPSPDNVRPISGWTGANIYHGKENYIDTAVNGKSLNSKGAESTEAGQYVTAFIPVSEGDVLKFHFTSTSGARTRRVVFYDANKAIASMAYVASWINVGTTLDRSFPIPDGVYYVRVCGYQGDADRQVYVNLATLPINWQTEAGTIYGGAVTLNEDRSVDVVSDYVKKVLNGSETWIASGSGTRRYFYTKIGDYGTVIDSGDICDTYKQANINANTTTNNAMDVQNSSGFNSAVIKIRPENQSTITVEEFKNLLSQNPVTVVYREALSENYHFANVGQLVTFNGTNNIWTDTNGTNTATYLKHQS